MDSGVGWMGCYNLLLIYELLNCIITLNHSNDKGYFLDTILKFIETYSQSLFLGSSEIHSV